MPIPMLIIPFADGDAELLRRRTVHRDHVECRRKPVLHDIDGTKFRQHDRLPPGRFPCGPSTGAASEANDGNAARKTGTGALSGGAVTADSPEK